MVFSILASVILMAIAIYLRQTESPLNQMLGSSYKVEYNNFKTALSKVSIFILRKAGLKIDMEGINSKLELAGRPAGLSAEEFVGLNTLLVGLVTALSIGISAAGKFPIWLSLILIFVSAKFPMEIIKNEAKQGRERMRKDVVDLGARLESGTSAGLTIIRMLEWASEGDTLLAKELRKMVSEVQMGKPLHTVFSRIGMRYDIPEADELTLLIKHADQQGVEIARHLRSLNRDFRTRREVEMNNEAAKIKPKVTMVLVLTAIVATWTLVAGPPVQRALEQGFFNFGTF